MVHRREQREHGQVIVLFAFALIAMLAIASLVFTGAHALVVRRQLQDSGDAAALAAANVMQNGAAACTSSRISSSGSAGSNDLYLAARASVMANLGWTAAQVASRMSLSCPTDSVYGGTAIQVNLTTQGPSLFTGERLAVSTSSVGMNGQVANGDHSVVLLDPSHVTWPANRRGCPSFLVNGGVTATFEGSIMIDSTCLRSESANAAMKAQNSAFRIDMVNGSTIRIAGEYAQGTGDRISPVPIERARPILPDPLGGLIKPCNAVDAATNCLGSATSLPTVNMSGTGQGICKSQDPCVLTPGTYTGGIVAGGGANTPSTVLLRPGVYFIRGGGLQLKSASARIFAIPGGNATQGYTDATAKLDFATSKTQAQVSAMFMSKCPQPSPANPAPSTCGVLIYNAPSTSTASWNANQDTISAGAQGVFQLRAYVPANDTIVANRTTFAPYRNLVIWQARTPAPTGSGQTQPALSMSGGACVTLSGTVYAPGGAVQFGGGSCGSGGGDQDLTLQFICWDLTLAGNNNFYFAYQKEYFATPTGYGLVR